LLLLFAAWTGCVDLPDVHAADRSRPNVLFIFSDDQNYKTVSCYPESPRWVKTPAIDRLAARGVRFERSYCGSWCMPSRASLLTGRLPYAIESMHMVGAYPGSAYDAAKCPFWPAELRKHGYQTAQIGKWHTGTDTGFGRDWDYQIVWNRPLHPENAGAYYTGQIMSFNGQERKVDGYSTDNYSQWAADYIRGEHRAADKPWYLWLCYGAIHGPTTPAERHRGAYSGNAAIVPADIVGPRPGKPAYLETTQAWMLKPDGTPARIKRKKAKNNFDADTPGQEFDAWIQQVNECVKALDEGIAKVMTALEESGQLENTLVVFTADQGFGLGEHGFNQKQAPYDASIAGPLIISQPGTWPEGKVSREPVNSPDLVSLFCTTTGLKLPWKTHGRDITALLRDPETAKLAEPMMMVHLGHYFGSDTRVIPTGMELTAEANTPWWLMLRVGSYKYIRNLVEKEIEELYDLEADPEELHNLAGASEHAERLAAMRDQLNSELERTEAPFAGNLPSTRPLKP
jgi:arylsulfatase A-like enzyme